MDSDGQEHGADELARREAEAAAAEAREIGGPAPDYAGADEDRAVEESGGGVAEGFEDSERELMEAATHGERRHNPAEDAFPPEERADDAGSVYAEPDEVDPTEVVRDPREEPGDPGEGPGLAADR